MDAKQFNINGTTVLLKDESARNRIAAVEGKLPSDASSSNKLITKTVDDLVYYYLKSETYTKSEVEALIGAIQHFHYEVYASTGSVTNPQSNVLYLIGPTGSGSDRYEEYVYTNNTWTKIGDTSIDLSGYVTTEALNTALAAYTTTANLTTLLAGKQDVISDLATIRSGAAAGATAYQKPGTGIPKTDLDSGVKASLELADSAIQPAEFNELEEEVGTIGNGAYEEAWDGSSAPVVADIPAGVSVTYSGTSYTGTLAASASTVDKIYLVSDGNGNYDRYVTVESGGTYSWKKVGTTAIPLSNYATKSEVNQLGQEVDDINDAISESTTKVIPTVHLTGLKLRTAGITAESSSYELNYFAATANVAYTINFTHSTGTIRFAYSTQIPAVGVSVTNYKTSASTEGSRTFTPTENCYIIVANDGGFGAGDPTVVAPKDAGIGMDVLALKQQVAGINDTIGAYIIYNDQFALTGMQICDGTDARYPAGSLANNVAYKASELILCANIEKVVYSLIAYQSGNALAVAFYDEAGTFISGLKSDGAAETTLLSSSFPSGAYYVCFSTPIDGNFYAKIYCDKGILQLAGEITNLKNNPAPKDVFWAVCGDSITHGNMLTPLAADDPYRPFDDYVGKSGYENANSGAYPIYAYHFCKAMRMKWANYGYGGTILGNYVPKYVGENNYLYPFIASRITQFADVPWNYISILFGVNDNVYGPIYQKDKWLTATYGTDLGYPVNEAQVGAAGFATAEQKAACDALGEAYFFDAFIGSINDTGTDTFYGAWNYALTYLMVHYPNVKIMIMAPFIGGADRTNSEKMRAAVLAVAGKYGVACFDFNGLEWWYYTTVINSTPFPNPERQDGRWEQENGTLTPATIEGYNRARFCKDSIHPTELGQKWIAEPIGRTLLER